MEQKQIVDRTTYKFERTTSYENGEQFTDVKIWTEDALNGCYSVSWQDVHSQFVAWLGSVYGYDISHNIIVIDEADIQDALQASAQAAQDCPGCAY